MAPYDTNIAEDLLAAIKYKEYPGRISTFLFSTAYDIEALLGLFPDPLADYDSIRDHFEMLADCVNRRANPNHVFDIMSYGYNKECYSFGANLVIKFCAMRNPTQEEESLALNAFYEDLDEVFTPSRYIALPVALPSEVLEKEDEEEYDPETDSWEPRHEWYDNTEFNYVCLQPRIEVCEPMQDHFWALTQWEKRCAELGIPLQENVVVWDALSEVPTPWLKSVIDFFGLDYTRKLAQFCHNNRVYDLHYGNVGYWNGHPVLLDWCST